MKRIAVLGSTGSIGRNTLEVIKNFPKEFSLVGLAVHSNVDALLPQIKKFNPELVAVSDAKAALALSKQCAKMVRIFSGDKGLAELVTDKQIDWVVVAISGSAALLPLLKAIEAGKNIALANKESVVMAGSLISAKAKEHNVKIIPIDSEQSAIWQCLQAHDKQYLKKIYLTASGGPFHNFTKEALGRVSLRDVLRHPCWKMGKRITVDSATLMNKGLEVIETMNLFSIDSSKIDVLIHPEVVVHSMVEFVDRSIIAQLSFADMRIPIQYALSYPKRLSSGLPGVDFCKLRTLSFKKPDKDKFPCLRIAYDAARLGGSAPCVLNAADEVAVKAFLDRKIRFASIPKIIEKTMQRMRFIGNPGLEDILNVDKQSRRLAWLWVEKYALN